MQFVKIQAFILIVVFVGVCYTFNYKQTGRLEMSELHLPHDHHHDKQHEETLSNVAIIEDFNLAADVFKQLGDGSRLRIFWILCHLEDCVLNISAMVGMSSPAVSHHLKQLKAAGLITSRRSGKEMFYKAADNERSRLLHCTIEELLGIICPEK